MTEPELVQVLSGRFNVDEGLLRTVSSPDFPKKLFEKHNDEQTLAHVLLLMIFDRGITAGVGLCDAEKAIVREVRSWPKEKITPGLKHVTYMFLNSDIEPEQVRYRRYC